jgi:hypothetical protein
MKIFALVLGLGALTLATGTTGIAHAAEPAPAVLARDGKALYQIALANDAIPAEKTAAEQLQKYLQQVTGAPFTIRLEGDVAATAPQILVGTGTRVKKLLPQQDWSALGHDGIVVKTSGKSLILAGGRPRGSLYAVFQFLEDAAECRWWTPAAATIPQRRTLSVAPQNTIYTPPFPYREQFSTGPMGTDPLFPTTLRENGHYQKQPAEWGGHYNILGFVHTFDRLLPPEKYFKAHPEWYSDQKNGNKPSTATSIQPEPQQSQLCVTNPEVLAELTKQALIWVRENPDAGYISISENDNTNYCQCDNCANLAKSEGSMAGPYLTLVNAVAAKVHEVNPDFLVETLAYHQTEKPPLTVRPANNVIIRLAPIYANFGQKLDSEANKGVRDNLQEWAKISNHLFYWHYVTNFGHSLMPHPNWDTLAEDLRFMAANKVKGVFEQGNAYTNDVGDFNPMRAWLLGKLMWNPNLDQGKLTDEFLQGYFGAAAPALKEYIETVQASYRKQGWALTCFNDDFTFLTLDTMNAATRAFDRAALAVKDDQELSERVQRERLSLDLAWIYRYSQLKSAAGTTGEFLGPVDPLAAIDHFQETAKSFGVQKTGESPRLDDQIQPMKNWFAPAIELPEFAKAYPSTDVYDYQPRDLSLVGGIADIVEDPAASDGKTVAMTTEKYEWAVQARLSRYLTGRGKWHIYAMMRVETKDNAGAIGDAFQGGIYDIGLKRTAGGYRELASTLVGKTFQKVDLGIHELNPGQYLYFARPENSNVEKLFIDRIILIREP